MLKWILTILLKDYVDELVDKRFKEKMYERYYETRQQQLRERIERLRKNLHSPIQRKTQNSKREEEPSSVLEVPRHPEPRVRKKANKKVDNSNWYEDTMKEVEKARAKREEMDKLKAKLGGKKW